MYRHKIAKIKGAIIGASTESSEEKRTKEATSISPLKVANRLKTQGPTTQNAGRGRVLM